MTLGDKILSIFFHEMPIEHFDVKMIPQNQPNVYRLQVVDNECRPDRNYYSPIVCVFEQEFLDALQTY
jgi:hypothetical protein